MKLSEKEDSIFERVLVFGGPKSGKTELAGALTTEFDLLYFDLENGYKTLRKLPQKQQDRVELISIPDTKVYPIATDTMAKIIPGNPVAICRAHGKVTCHLCLKSGGLADTVELNKLPETTVVVVDSLTQLALSAMNNIFQTRDDDAKADWEDYRKQGFRMDRFLSQVQQAKFNIVCITHEVESELEDGRKRLVPVAGTREFSRNTAKYFDHVVYCEVKNKKHAFGSSTTYAMSVLTGSRTDIDVEKLTVPSLLPFFRHEIRKTEGTSPGQQAMENLKSKFAASAA